MARQIETDEFLRRFAAEHRDELSDRLVPDFSGIAERVRAESRRRRKKQHIDFALKAAVAIIVVGVLFNAMIFLNGDSSVKAYKNDVNKFFLNFFTSGGAKNTTSDGILTTNPSIDEIQKKTPFHIPVPTWLPAGYEFDDVTLTDNYDDTYDVTIKYISGSNIIRVLVSDNNTFSKTEPADIERNHKVVVQDGLTLYITIPQSDEDLMSCTFLNENGLLVRISGQLDEQSLLEVIQGLK